MTISRRSFLGSTAALAAMACGGRRARQALVTTRGGSVVPPPPPPPPGVTPHYLVLVTLRGGFDNVMSLAPKEQDSVGDKIYCGYRADERVRGSKRMFGPLIDGLVRHDDDLCIIHGVRSDTTNHPDGLAMLARGSRSSRPGEIAATLAEQLAGTAPLPTLDLATADGQLALNDAPRPSWADLRAQAQRSQLAALAASEPDARVLGRSAETSATLEKFLDETKHDSDALDTKFSGFMSRHFRLAYQAIRGNWAKCVQIGCLINYFDSHSDNVRYQRERQPSTFKDLATFIDLLKATRNDHGALFDQTTIAVYSELGRFPRLNAQAGKDHFPENSWLMLGKGVARGTTIGGLDNRGKGVDVDFRTGQPSQDHSRPIYLENGFATLVAIAGGDPIKAGYAKESVLSCVQS